MQPTQLRRLNKLNGAAVGIVVGGAASRVRAPLAYRIVGPAVQTAGPIVVWPIVRARHQPAWVETPDALTGEISDCQAPTNARPCGSSTWRARKKLVKVKSSRNGGSGSSRSFI